MTSKKKQLKQLYEQAKEILKSRPPKTQTIPYSEIYKILEENELYQIALELQNEELHKSILRFEEEHSRYVDLYDFIPFGCFILNQQGIIVEINEAGADLIGFKKTYLINKNLSRYVAANFQATYINHFQQVINNPSLQSCEIKLSRKNGPLFYAQLDTKSVINSITKKTYLLMFVKDISERKQEESYLHEHQKKLATFERNNSMGEFAEIISHELNHPLAVISNYLHGCIRRLEAGKFQTEDIINALQKASDQSHRINEIILRMKNFTCKGTMNFEMVDINQLINEAISLIYYEHAGFQVNVLYYPINNPPPIIVDKINIEQVIINLARNAIEAMRDANISDSKIIIEANYVDTEKIEISIADNGPGISPNNLHKLFNPYFTTKSYGVGLGLAVSRKVIEAHGGNIHAESHPLGGTCFKFTLSMQQLNPYLISTFGNENCLLKNT